MLTTTINIIRCGLEADPTLTPADRARIIAAVRDGANPRTSPEAPPPVLRPQLLRREEVSRRLACSLRTVDKLPLKKIKLPGRQRAAGFLESDVNALLAGQAC